MSADGEILLDPAADYPDFLRDESRRMGCAESISFPTSEVAVQQQIVAIRERGLPITIQAARTGITGGAVPQGGHILNLGRMNKILGVRFDDALQTYIMKVQPGVLLSQVREALSGGICDGPSPGAYFFPPDPTEASAAIGGMVACNASGAQSFFYGSTRRYVQRLRVVLADGEVLELTRDVEKAEGRGFVIRTQGGREIRGDLPHYTMPRVKNASGYYASADSDLIDLFIGSEGTLGVITEIDLRLLPAPGSIWGVMCFFASAEAALAFVRKVRGACRADATGGLVAVELFDRRALDLLRRQKQTNPAFRDVQDIPDAVDTAVYVEFHGSDEEAVEDAVVSMSEIMVGCGGDEDATWLASDGRELMRLKGFRHAVPEAVNLLIDERRKTEPALTKLGTDLAVPDEALADVMALYHRELAEADLQYVVFGHVGDNHVHVNIIPRNLEEYEKGKQLYLGWAGKVVAMGGTVSAEHGIGKLKVALLEVMYGEEGIREMMRVKKLFDPDGMLNQGNLFPGP